MGKYFGTDGFRGEANVELTAEKAFRIGRFLGWYFGREHANGTAQIAIGKDTRRSSYMLEDALSAGITASGSDVYLLHVTTTPSVSYVVRTENFDCGIMISASHNPFYDNGIKIIQANGQKMPEEVEAKIEAFIDGDGQDIPYAHRADIGRTIDFAAGRNRYIGYLLTLPSRNFKGVRVGLDCSNGAASTVAKSVFDALGAKTFVIHAEPDGTNINDQCGSTHPEALQKYVVENGLDIGFAYDGDADRCLAVDEKGELITGDHILYMCGKHMKEQGQLDGNKIVSTVMSNLGFYKACDAADIGYEQTQVGDRYVAERMSLNGYSLGGEQSGHIIFGRYAATGDGILTSLMVMQTMLERKLPISMLASEMTLFPQVLKNVAVTDKSAAMSNKAVLAAVEEVEKDLGADGRVLVRESGTEPLVRVMVEAQSNAICHEMVDRVIKVMKEEGLTIS